MHPIAALLRVIVRLSIMLIGIAACVRPAPAMALGGSLAHVQTELQSTPLHDRTTWDTERRTADFEKNEGTTVESSDDDDDDDLSVDHTQLPLSPYTALAPYGERKSSFPTHVFQACRSRYAACSAMPRAPPVALLNS